VLIGAIINMKRSINLKFEALRPRDRFLIYAVR